MCGGGGGGGRGVGVSGEGGVCVGVRGGGLEGYSFLL